MSWACQIVLFFNTPRELLAHILQGLFTAPGMITFSKCQWKILKARGEINWYQTITKHNKMWTIYILLVMYINKTFSGDESVSWMTLYLVLMMCDIIKLLGRRHSATPSPSPSPSLITRLMGPTWGPSGADRTQVGPILAPWTLLSGIQQLVSIIQWIIHPTASLILRKQSESMPMPRSHFRGNLYLGTQL